MQAYQTLYPYAVICMAIVASCMTIVGGLYTFIVLVVCGRDWALSETQRRAALNGNIPPNKVMAGDILPYVMGGTALFVVACLAAMIELKIGAWVASIGCS
jgi:hypothetical protein